MDGFAAHDLFERLTEGVFAENADAKWSFWIRKGLGRPLDKLREVEQKRGLDLIFARDWLCESFSAKNGAEKNCKAEEKSAAQMEAQTTRTRTAPKLRAAMVDYHFHETFP